MNKHLAFLQECIGSSTSDKGMGAVSKWINGTLLFAEEGHLKFAFVVEETWLNPAKTFHGGMAATLIDDVMGVTIYSLGSEIFYSTVNLNLDYLSFALAGDTITVEARVVRKGIAVIHIEAFIYKRNKLLVKATSNVVSSGKKVF
ncbi:MAG: PaaI family thioesterase [Bacteroidota bacterium]